MTVLVADLKKLVDLPETKVDSDLQPFLDTARLIVSEDLSGTSLSAARLELIELNLAAHYAVVSLEYGGLQEWQAGESKEQYKSIDPKAVGLDSTRFGQQALALDSSGTLRAKLSTKRTARFTVVKAPDECQEDTET